MTGRRVVIVGGGITGLAAAQALEARERSGADLTVTVLEASPRLGGTIRSQKQGDLLLDVGADGWVANKPQATDLARKVGLGDSLIETSAENRGLYLGWNNQLTRVPDGLVLGVPSQWGPVLGSSLFTPAGKSRMLLEPYIPAKVWAEDDDESIVSFITRRLGAELAEVLGAPLLGGIVSGDVSELSIRATFPQLVEAERNDGSLVKSARKRARDNARPAGAPVPSPFRSLTGGVESLVAAIAKSLVRTTVRTSAAVTSITSVAAGSMAEPGYAIRLDGGETLSADAVLVACPFGVAAKLLSPVSDAVAAAFAPLRETRSAAVLLTYKKVNVGHPLSATGFLVPRTVGRPVAAATWLSQKWAGRAPDDTVIVRAFLRADHVELPDERLVQMVNEDVRAWMAITGEPTFATVARWTRPFLAVGHLTRMAELRAALAALPHLLAVGGSGYSGVGIPDAIAQGQAFAARALATTP